MSNESFSINRRQALGARVVELAVAATISNSAIANTQKPLASASGKANANSIKDKEIK